MTMFKVLFGLSVCAVLASAIEQSDNYIINGRNGNRGQFPWLISLRTVENQHFCGGFIISERWVGTAATCTQGNFRNPKNILVVNGAHTMTDGQRHRVSRVVIHPRYNKRTRAYDFALLQTADQIPLLQPPYRSRAIFFPRGPANPGKVTLFAGWGYTEVS